MSKFQVITLAIFIVAIIAGVIAFATYKSKSTTNQLPPVTIWGTFPSDTFTHYLSSINNNIAEPLSVTYVQKSPDTFAQDFVNALATGRGPDAILVTADSILPDENKLTPIPYGALSQRDFLDTYVQEANMYLTNGGILAIPFTIDPLVMYWNRDVYNAAGLTTYPHYWDEFTSLNQSLTTKDDNGNVRKSAVAMGTMNNIQNAREVLGSLFLQLGNPVTIANGDGTAVTALKSGSSGTAGDPAAALSFFAQFANPSSANYSWNKALTNDKVAFLSGTLSTYFGFASELADIRAKNPNLNFDVAPLPQVRSGGRAAAYGRMYGFSVVRASPNQNAAYQVMSILSSAQFLPTLAKMMYLPTVMNALDRSSTDPYIDNFNKAALIARSWLDAGAGPSRDIMSTMVDALVSGKKTAPEAIQEAGSEYDVLLQRATQ